MTALPLAGRRVVVTRAADQAGDLADLLRQAGAEPVVVPLIEIAAPTDGGAALDDAMKRLDEYDWLVVTSPNGATRVAAGLTATRASGAAPDLRVAAVGSSTASGLGRPADLVAERQNAEGLLEVFPDGPGRVLVAQADRARPTLVDGLIAKGFVVDAVPAYRTVSVRPDRGDMLRALSADAVLFASGSAAVAWHEVFGTSTPPLVVAIGPSTAVAADRIGLKIDVVATDHSLDGLVTCLMTYLGDSD